MARGRNNYFSGKHGVPWIQPNGPNTAPYYLGNAGVGDISAPKGDITREQVRDPRNRDKYITIVRDQAEPGEVTFDIEALTSKTASYLEDMVCPAGVYVVQSHCDDRRLFNNYERVLILTDALLTDETEANVAQRTGSDASTQTFAFSAEALHRVYPVRASLQSLPVAGVTNATDVVFDSMAQCRGDCGEAKSNCQIGYVALAGGAAAKPMVFRTTSSGSTWTQTAADPLVVDDDIASLALFPVSRGVYRVLAACGTTGAGRVSISYSDDEGATWTNVLVGTTATGFFLGPSSVFALDFQNIWCCTSGLDHEILFSDDGGLTWTAQNSGAGAGIDLYAIKFVDENYGICVGEDNFVATTLDGGLHWSEVTPGPGAAGAEIISCEMIDSKNWWVGLNNGTMFYTFDGGVTWSARVPTVGGTLNRVNDISFIDDYVGFASVKYTSGGDVHGAVVRTFNGGFTWEETDLGVLDVGALGAVAVWPCNANTAFAVGDLIAAVPLVATVNK